MAVDPLSPKGGRAGVGGLMQRASEATPPGRVGKHVSHSSPLQGEGDLPSRYSAPRTSV